MSTKENVIVRSQLSEINENINNDSNENNPSDVADVEVIKKCKNSLSIYIKLSFIFEYLTFLENKMVLDNDIYKCFYYFWDLDAVFRFALIYQLALLQW